ncbi:MAG: GspH/FimT family pseudopilin [Candidatus Eisenbacteria sp.]|nr:GspH/FimT family pseudopilin [Candidatus Eisenbacteria bacterium]
MKAYSINRKREGGFSLIELMVVIAMIGVLLGCSFVSLRHGMPGHGLRAASTDLASELRLSRQKAITENNNYTVTFDTGTQSYSIWDDDGSDGYHSAEEEVRVIALAEGVVFGTVNIGASNVLTFRANGSASSGGYVELRNNSSVARRVSITRSTGTITESRVDG